MTLSFATFAPLRREFTAAAAYFIAVAALAVPSLWFMGDLRERSVETASAQTRLEELTERAKSQPPGSIAANVAGSPFLDGPTITVAGAGLQERLGTAVAKAGGALISSQVELDGPDAKAGFINLTANLELGQTALQPMLYDIEAGMPYLFVEKLSIQSPESFGEPETGRMRVTIGVAGQWRRSE